MLDLAGVTTGSKVLDIAAGTGGQSVPAARRAGPDGRVLATDISAGILAQAQRRFELAGLANATTRQMDGEQLDVQEGHYDAVISRLGLIYFPDRAGALASVPAARCAPAGGSGSWCTGRQRRTGSSRCRSRSSRPAAGLGAPLPGQPGPFSLGGDGVLEQALAQAGFSDVEVRAVDAPLRLTSAAECLRFEQESFGALHQMLTGLAEPERAAAWEQVGEALKQFESADGFSAPCRLLVGGGTK